MLGRQIIRQGKSVPPFVTHRNIVILQPANLIQFRMFRFIERAETQRQVHLSGQQFRQRRTMRQITQFETQTRRLVVKSGHQGWKNALRGEIRDRDL